MNGFRIFDKQEKKYISEFLSQYYLNHEGNLFFIFTGYGKYNELHKELDPGCYVVEFSTGLKDKNGVEIYEGDIVFVDYNYFGKVKVCYERGKWSVSVYDLTRVKIIGNIHGEADGKK